MAKTLSKSGISTGQDVLAWHVTQSIDAFNASSSYDIAITGSLTVTGSIVAKDSVVNFESATSVSGSVFSGSTYYGDGSNLTNLPQTSLLSGSSNDLTASGDLSASGNITAFTYTASHGFNAQAHNDFEFSIVGENSFNMKHWTPNRDLFFLTHAGSGSINLGTNNTNGQFKSNNSIW